MSAGTAGGCGSVEVPEEHYYRLVLPVAVPAAPAGESRPAPRNAAVLRVEAFELAASLSPDRLLVADTPVQLRAYEFHRWIGPLDRLVQDAVRDQLTRAGAFAEVKGPADDPGEGLVLTGRILDFHQVVAGGAWAAKATLQLRLQRADDRRVVFHEEFSATEAMPESDPAAAVGALSAATAEVIRQFLERCVAVDLEGAARPGR